MHVVRLSHPALSDGKAHKGLESNLRTSVRGRNVFVRYRMYSILVQLSSPPTSGRISVVLPTLKLMLRIPYVYEDHYSWLTYTLRYRNHGA